MRSMSLSAASRTVRIRVVVRSMLPVFDAIDYFVVLSRLSVFSRN